jgi:signal transduction histidine kinase
VLVALIALIWWQVRLRRKETQRRRHVQTRLLVQNKLVEQRDEFDNIFHSIKAGIVTYDASLHIHFINHALMQMVHLPPEGDGRGYEGRPAGSIFHIFHNGKDILHSMLNGVLKSGQSQEIPANTFAKETGTGRYFPVSGEIQPIYGRNKKSVKGLVLYLRNTTNEERQKRFFNMAVDENGIYPCQYDTESNSFLFPQGFLMRFGFNEGINIISRADINRIIHPQDLPVTSLSFDKILLGKLNDTRLSFRVCNAAGEYEWWEFRFSVTKGIEEGSLYNVLGVCQNIQRFKDAEQGMKEARDKALQADRLKTAFLANMSHEIRTPLNAIVGFSDLLSNASDFSPEEVQQFVETINKNCALLLALINDILDLSRIESGTMEFVLADHNLPLLLKNINDSQRLNMPPGVELRLQLPPGEKTIIKTDSLRLQQVVNNLINNAAKFTTKGNITFGYEYSEEQGCVSLFVEDTGVGISEEGLKHIFERFYKEDNFTQGAGLGLSICSTIVEHLNGTISVASELGKGTRFTVRIPKSYE